MKNKMDCLNQGSRGEEGMTSENGYPPGGGGTEYFWKSQLKKINSETLCWDISNP